jgi:WD40 repeat protein
MEEVPIMKNSTMTMARTHEGVVSETLYNPLFHQVITAGHDGYVIVWDMFSGQKIIQFKAGIDKRKIIRIVSMKSKIKTV